MSKWLLALGLSLSISCASLAHNAVKYSTQVTKDLQKISQDSDLALTHNAISQLQRRQIAQNIIIPSSDFITSIITFLITYDPKNPIPTGFASLSQQLLAGVNSIIAGIASGNDKTILIADLNTAITHVNNWLGSVVKK